MTMRFFGCSLLLFFSLSCFSQFDKFFWEKRTISDSLSTKTLNGLAIFNKIQSDSIELKLYYNYPEIDPFILPIPTNEPVIIKMDAQYQLDKKVLLSIRGKIIKDLNGNRFLNAIVFDNNAYDLAMNKCFVDSEDGLFGFEEYKKPIRSQFERELQLELKLTKYKFELDESLKNLPIKESSIVKTSSYAKIVFRQGSDIFTIYMPN